MLAQAISPKISRLLRALHVLARVGVWLWPAITVGWWFFLEFIPLSELQRMSGGINSWMGASLIVNHTTLPQFTWKVKLIGATLALFPAAIQFLFMRQWVKLFGLYRNGKIFALENVHCFAMLGRFLLALSIYDIVLSMPIHSLVLTLDNPPGQHALSIGFSSDHIPTLATSLALIVIAWVMEEGCHLHREADLVV